MTEKQDAVWLRQQQKTSQSCHKPPDKLTAHSVKICKYTNKRKREKEKKKSHTQTDTGKHGLSILCYS